MPKSPEQPQRAASHATAFPPKAPAPAARSSTPADALQRLKEVYAEGGTELGVCSRRRLLSPLDIHFSQSHIRPEFQDGRTVEETAEQVQRELVGPIPPQDDGQECPAMLGTPTGDSNWWLLQPPFPEIEVIQWRIKLRDEDGTPKVDEMGMELYGEREWYTLDNRRLYCLQKAATAVYPSEVRCVVSVILPEDGSCREFRKFRTVDRGRSVGVGHRDSIDLPRWSWRREVGLPEEVFASGAALSKAPRRRGPSSRGHPPAKGGRRAAEAEDSDRSRSDFFANISFFLAVYVALRMAFYAGRKLLFTSSLPTAT